MDNGQSTPPPMGFNPLQGTADDVGSARCKVSWNIATSLPIFIPIAWLCSEGDISKQRRKTGLPSLRA